MTTLKKCPPFTGPSALRAHNTRFTTLPKVIAAYNLCHHTPAEPLVIPGCVTESMVEADVQEGAAPPTVLSAEEEELLCLLFPGLLSVGGGDDPAPQGPPCDAASEARGTHQPAGTSPELQPPAQALGTPPTQPPQQGQRSPQAAVGQQSPARAAAARMQEDARRAPLTCSTPELPPLSELLVDQCAMDMSTMALEAGIAPELLAPLAAAGGGAAALRAPSGSGARLIASLFENNATTEACAAAPAAAGVKHRPRRNPAAAAARAAGANGHAAPRAASGYSYAPAGLPPFCDDGAPADVDDDESFDALHLALQHGWLSAEQAEWLQRMVSGPAAAAGAAAASAAGAAAAAGEPVQPRTPPPEPAAADAHAPAGASSAKQQANAQRLPSSEAEDKQTSHGQASTSAEEETSASAQKVACASAEGEASASGEEGEAPPVASAADAPTPLQQRTSAWLEGGPCPQFVGWVPPAQKQQQRAQQPPPRPRRKLHVHRSGQDEIDAVAHTWLHEGEDEPPWEALLPHTGAAGEASSAAPAPAVSAVPTAAAVAAAAAGAAPRRRSSLQQQSIALADGADGSEGIASASGAAKGGGGGKGMNGASPTTEQLAQYLRGGWLAGGGRMSLLACTAAPR